MLLMQTFARFVMAAIVVVAGIHCGCGNCFATVEATPQASAVHDMACCTHEAPESAKHSDPSHHHSGDHRTTCETGFETAPVTGGGGGKVVPPSPFFVMPAIFSTELAIAPFTGSFSLRPDPMPAFRDGTTLVRLHCALVI